MRVPRTLTLLALIPALLLAAACGSGSGDKDQAKVDLQATAPAIPQAKADNPVDKVTLGSEQISLSFWHNQPMGVRLDKLNQIVADFQAKNPNIKINAEFVGNYTDLYKKLSTSIAAGSWPDIAVAYPNQVSEYQQANVVIPLDDYITSEKYGLTKADVDDFVEAFLAESRYYPEYGNKYLSFPFVKSVLTMYYNQDKLTEAGQKLPTTWDEFRSVCKAVTKGDTKCLAIAVSASTIDGMIYSYGGKLLSDDGKTWQMNQPPGVSSLQLLQEMVKEGTAYYAEKLNADQEDFGKGRTVFTFGSSSGIPFYTAAMDGGVKQKWGIANIPHAANVQPVTVLYGGSITMLKSNPQKQLAAWQFFKYFTSPEVTAEWGVASGYMPVRKSSQSIKVVTDYIAKFPPYATVIKEIAPTSKPETSVKGTQEMRDALENAEVAVITDLNKSPKAALDEAFQKAQKALSQ